MHRRIEECFRQIVPAADFCSLRFVQERSEVLAVRQNVLQPVMTSEDLGAMVTVIAHGGLGYAGTSDITQTWFATRHRVGAGLGTTERQTERGGFFEDGVRVAAG